MSLVRASGFCRPNKGSSFAVTVTLPLHMCSSAEMATVAAAAAAAATEKPPAASCSVATLRNIGVTAGSLVWLTVIATNRRILVSIQVKDETEESRASSLCLQHSCSVSPLTAINLNCYSELILSTNNTTRIMVRLQACDCMPEVAKQVTLRLLGRPAMAACSKKKASIIAAEAAAPAAPSVPLPRRNALLEPSTILQIVATDDTTQEHVYSYEVLAVNNVVAGSEQQRRAGVFFQSTDDTNYQIVSCGAAGATVPRLPPFPTILSGSSRSFSSSISPSKVVPHPDVLALVEQWRGGGNTTTAINTVLPIYHVLGSNHEHHVVQAVKAAANVSGRRCVVALGLAATAYSLSKRDISTAGIQDKLAGLEAALDQARNCSPSVLLVADLCQELSTADDSVRRDEEGRIWAVLAESLSCSRVAEATGTTPASSLEQVPSVVVVFSTLKPLKPGPLLENLVFASLRASLPDPDYIEYLWTQHPIRQLPTASTTEKTAAIHTVESVPLETVQGLMKGRPAGEILELRDELMYARDTADGTGAVDDLQRLCLARDKSRRQTAGLGRIPSVLWQDVGGLANVRREIMDAIELPLKYPHMFSGGTCTRSGILLYGPPGTGKTLVAKAVATECGLPFISVKGPELLGSFVGESEANVRATFSQARSLAAKNQPPACVLFFDELDSLAPRRGESGGNVMDRVVATVFAELDKDGAVFCMGATNRPDLLDPALLRPGRFDRLVYLGVSASDHAHILATQLRKLRLESDVNELSAAIAATLPPNLTGADLSTIASGALLRATERLCDEADREALAQNVSVDRVLTMWSEERLEPVVTFDDLVQASRTVVPSVSAAELEQYEQLGQKYQMSART